MQVIIQKIKELDASKVIPFLLIILMLLCAMPFSFGQLNLKALDIHIPDVNSAEAGASWADIDADGDMDLLINTSDVSELYIDDKGILRPVASVVAPGLRKRKGKGKTLWGDLNNDGLLDFIRNISDENQFACEVYLQDQELHTFGDGRGGTSPILISHTDSADIASVEHYNEPKELGLFDFDKDGDLDLYIENAFQEVELFRNNSISPLEGDSSNADMALFSLKEIMPIYGSTLEVGLVDSRRRYDKSYKRNVFSAFYDVDNDGDFDAISINSSGCHIWTNEGIGQWFKREGILPLEDVGDARFVKGADMDNDGDTDLIFYGLEHTYVLLNDGGVVPHFTISEDLSLYERSCKDLEMVDIDKDGDIDLHGILQSGEHFFLDNQLYTDSTTNEEKSHIYIDVFEETKNNRLRFAHGVSVVVRDLSGEVVSGIQKVSGGLGEGRQRPLSLHFGLPYVEGEVYLIEVHHPTNYVNGNLKHKTAISKIVYPAKEENRIITIYMSDKSKVKMM